MSLITILIVLCIFAAVFWLVSRYAPTPAARTVGLIVVLIALLWWLLTVLGLLGPIGSVSI